MSRASSSGATRAWRLDLRATRAWRLGRLVAAGAALAALGGCSGARCEDPVVPVPMSLARAAELAPEVTRGLALTTALRATACPTMSLDGGALEEATCGPRDCGAERRALEILVVPAGASIPRHDTGCVRRTSELAPLASARALSSGEGELVLSVAAGEALVWIGDPTTDCAACGRVELGEPCAVSVPARGLVVRDLLLDRL